MKKTHAKTYIILAIFLSIVGISIAYAALQQQLQIKTSTTIQSSQTSWNIVVEKKYCAAYRNSGAYSRDMGDSTIEVNGTTITISNLIFQVPGDSFGCVFYIENKGEVNAKVESINTQKPTVKGTGSSAEADVSLIQSNFWSYLNWSNAMEIKKGDLLNAGEKKEIGLGYGIGGASMTTFPANPVTFSLTFSINFEQA